jgi:hypothetical protein
MTVLAHLAPEPPPGLPRAGWECPRCLTVYAPDVRACHCATKKPLSERIVTSTPVRLGGGCTCTPYGPGTAPCPVHQPPTWQVTC